MKRFSDLKGILEQLKIPVYEYFGNEDEDYELPLIVYYPDSFDTICADGIVVSKFANVCVELVLDFEKHPTTEKLEGLFAENEISYRKSIEKSDGEEITVYLYEFTVFDE